jgi:hypothetical protein
VLGFNDLLLDGFDRELLWRTLNGWSALSGGATTSDGKKLKYIESEVRAQFDAATPGDGIGIGSMFGIAATYKGKGLGPGTDWFQPIREWAIRENLLPDDGLPSGRCVGAGSRLADGGAGCGGFFRKPWNFGCGHRSHKRNRRLPRAAVSPSLRHDKVERTPWQVDPPSTLDGMVKKRRPKEDKGGQGQALELPDVDPWPVPVDGVELLNEIADEIQTYVILPDAETRAATLWIVSSHGFTVWRIFPRLRIKAPERDCGKSTAKDTIAPMTARELSIDGATASWIFRSIEMHRPTLLIGAGTVRNFVCGDIVSKTAGGGLWRSRRTHWTNYSRGAIQRRCFPRTGFSMS